MGTPTQRLLDLINSVEGTKLSLVNVSLGQPQPNTDPNYNTSLVINAVPGRGYSGSVKVNYKRHGLSEIPNNFTMTIQSGDSASMLAALNTDARTQALIDTSDVDFSQSSFPALSPGHPGVAKIVALASSLAWTGYNNFNFALPVVNTPVTVNFNADNSYMNLDRMLANQSWQGPGSLTLNIDADYWRTAPGGVQNIDLVQKFPFGATINMDMIPRTNANNVSIIDGGGGSIPQDNTFYVNAQASDGPTPPYPLPYGVSAPQTTYSEGEIDYNATFMFGKVTPVKPVMTVGSVTGGPGGCALLAKTTQDGVNWGNWFDLASNPNPSCYGIQFRLMAYGYSQDSPQGTYVSNVHVRIQL